MKQKTYHSDIDLCHQVEEQVEKEMDTGNKDTHIQHKTCVKRSLKNRQNKDLNDKW